MSSETTMMAEQYHLHEWGGKIGDCQSRLFGKSVVSWYICYGNKKANYYYRLRCVREACFESIFGENSPQ